MGPLSALYYPFSRCIDEQSLKQMLLVFDTVTFLDPVDDDEWRAQLFRDLEHQEDRRFNKYRRIHGSTQVLVQEGAVQRVAPASIQSLAATTTVAATVSDLLDPDWVHDASKPADYHLPHRNLAPDGGATWQIFRPKIPDRFLDVVYDSEPLRRHLVHEGTSNSSWTLSYEAGSALALNGHLAAAAELDLAPITDSHLHHRLVLRKMLRQGNHKGDDKRPVMPEVAEYLARDTAISLLSSLVHRRGLEGASF